MKGKFVPVDHKMVSVYNSIYTTNNTIIIRIKNEQGCVEWACKWDGRWMQKS